MFFQHGINELQRQADRALSRKKQADKDYDDALSRLHRAWCEATGLLGKVASCGGRTILIQDMDFMSGKLFLLRGVKIKKDGTPSNSPSSMHHSMDVIISLLTPEEVEGEATAAVSPALGQRHQPAHEDKPASGEGETR